MALMINDKVRHKNDPRYVGVVRGFFSGNIVKIMWGESEWIEYLHRDKLEKLADGHEYLLKQKGI